ncbi:MAG: DUF1353 domain-containing protein [Pseudomonadota bacterium]
MIASDLDLKSVGQDIDGRRLARLNTDWFYCDRSTSPNRIILVPKGYVTDFISRPPQLFFVDIEGFRREAAVLHDWLYAMGIQSGVTRDEADQLLRQALLENGDSKLVSNLFYGAVQRNGQDAYGRQTEWDTRLRLVAIDDFLYSQGIEHYYPYGEPLPSSCVPEKPRTSIVDRLPENFSCTQFRRVIPEVSERFRLNRNLVHPDIGYNENACAKDVQQEVCTMRIFEALDDCNDRESCRRTVASFDCNGDKSSIECAAESVYQELLPQLSDRINTGDTDFRSLQVTPFYPREPVSLESLRNKNNEEIFDIVLSDGTIKTDTNLRIMLVANANCGSALNSSE